MTMRSILTLAKHPSGVFCIVYDVPFGRPMTLLQENNRAHPTWWASEAFPAEALRARALLSYIDDLTWMNTPCMWGRHRPDYICPLARRSKATRSALVGLRSLMWLLMLERLQSFSWKFSRGTFNKPSGCSMARGSTEKRSEWLVIGYEQKYLATVVWKIKKKHL
jgi:hypothetical protein